jgi:alkylated DNA repair dioxygenase AlkB
MIQGLKLIDQFITLEEERTLLTAIDAASWNTSLKRRTQHYGFTYDYGTKAATEVAEPIPPWCDSVMDRLVERGVITERPDQMIVNEYMPGQGIYPHVDDPSSFDDGIVSLSLGSNIAMDLIECRTPSNKKEVLLRRRSVIAFHGDARYRWRHGIVARMTDHGVKRGRRVSLTFRKMKVGSKRQRVDGD